MKNLIKITSALIAFTLLFTACSKDDDDKPQQKISRQITKEELTNYIIIHEFTPKAENEASYGKYPRLLATYFVLSTSKDIIGSFSGSIKSYLNSNLSISYDEATGITSLDIDFAKYELSRNENGDVILVKVSPKNSTYIVSNYFNSQHAQIVKRTQTVYNNSTYKQIGGEGYYRFNQNLQWIYKTNTPPSGNDLLWNYRIEINQIWIGRDDGTAKYNNLFILIPKGIGWKDQHKDKDLLIVHTSNYYGERAVGETGVYELTN